MLKLDSLTEDGSTDNERVNKLAAQNKDLNVSVPYIYNVSFICFYNLIYKKSTGPGKFTGEENR